MQASQMFDLSGKRALITGGSSGLGRAIADAFQQAGAKVTIAGNRAEEVASTAAELDLRGIHAVLGSRAAAETLAEEVGPVDILVSNAGIEGPTGGVTGMDEADYMRVFDVNLHTSIWLSAALAPAMAAAGGGSVILMASLSALRGNRMITTYSMTKAALNQMTRLLAKSCGPVRVNAVAPGLVATPWTSDWAVQHEGVKRMAPVPRSATPDDCAEAVLALVRNTYVTGEIFVVDGGLTQVS